jgi:hypothetical protein
MLLQLGLALFKDFQITRKSFSPHYRPENTGVSYSNNWYGAAK